MMEWIEQHQAVLSIGISFATLLVWLVYAQLLFSSYRRQRSPRLIINRGKQKDMDALCIISNMSKEAIYVEYILATLTTSKGSIIMDITDFEQAPAEASERGETVEVHNRPTASGVIQQSTRQGPLQSGDFTHICTFVDIVRRLLAYQGIEMRGYSPEGDLRLNCLTIEIIALYGPDYRPISATRSFDINSDEYKGALTPASWGTQQGHAFWHRRRLCKMVNQMNESNFSARSTIARDE